MAAYTLLLLGGYFYAHAIAARPLKTQMRLHLAFLGAAAAWGWVVAVHRPALLRALAEAAGAPQLAVLLAVAALIGAPYLALAAGSTLVQAWAERAGGRDVYALYAVSNLGSLLGLLAYPLALEPHVGATMQWQIGRASCRERV